MKINIDKFIRTYRVEIEKNKKEFGLKFKLHLFVLMLIYSIGFEKFGEKAIYHVFMMGICAIFCACWDNNWRNKKGK